MLSCHCRTRHCPLVASTTQAAEAARIDDVIALERAALDRWGAGDPQGFLDTYAPEVTYFDIGTEHRLDGHAAMSEYYRPLVGKIKIPRYEMIDPKVQRHGDVAVLTYNLRSEALQPDGKQVTVRWNSTPCTHGSAATGRWSTATGH